MFGPATGSVAYADLDRRVAELVQEILREAGKLLDNLDAPDLTREFRQDCCLIPQPGSDFEDLLV